MTVTTPIYSFVRFDADRFKLPLRQNDVLRFQVRITDTGDADDWSLIVRNTSGGSNASTSDVSFTKEGTLLNVSVTVTGEVEGNSYQIQLQYVPTGGGLPSTFNSNTFVGTTVESKVVTYSHHDDHLDFGYDTTMTALSNQVRLPIHVYNFVPSSVTERYQKSDGSFVTLGASVNRTYSIDTDWLAGDFHQCVMAMWLHSSIQMDIDGVTRSVQLLEDYEVNYSDNQHYGKAKGSATISAV